MGAASKSSFENVSMTYTLKVDHDTWFKLSTADHTALPNDQKLAVLAGTEFPITSYEIASDCLKVSLSVVIQGIGNQGNRYSFKELMPGMYLDPMLNFYKMENLLTCCQHRLT